MRQRQFLPLLGATVGMLALGGPACTAPPSAETRVEQNGEADPASSAEAVTEAESPPPPLGEIPPGPIAVVGEVEIGRDAFLEIYRLKLQKYEDRDRPIPRSADRRYRKSISERLIYQEVLRQEAEKLGVSVDDEELAHRQAQQRKGISDWERHLRRRGESDASLRDMFVAELRERAILEKRGALEVGEADIEAEYIKMAPNYDRDVERIRASHILISVGPEQKPAPGAPRPEPTEEEKEAWEARALKTAQEVATKARAPGADFAAIAQAYSEGPSARKGGDLGIFSSDRMVEDFSRAAFGLGVGEVSDPVKTKFGFHVIKVFGKYGPGPLPREAMEDQIVERLYNQRLHRGRRDLKEELLERYAIDDRLAQTLGPDPREAARRARAGKGGAEGARVGAAAGGPGEPAVGDGKGKGKRRGKGAGKGEAGRASRPAPTKVAP